MIKPISNNNLGVESIKVPHKNISFSGIESKIPEFGDEFVGKATSKVQPLLKRAKGFLTEIASKISEYAKKVPEFVKKGFEYAKKAGTFIADKFDKIKNFAIDKFNALRDITKNSGRKARAAAIGTAAGLGAVGVTTTAVKAGKKDNKD